eukprot:3656165-Karenia_brevis.AAC.1
MNMLERQIETSMQEVLAMDVAEIYSPPRVVDCAKEFNLEGGWSLDLTTCDTDGEPWDFNKVEMRSRAIRK